jgi:hypothetical protein
MGGGAVSPPHKAKAPAVHGGEAESVEPEATRIVQDDDVVETFDPSSAWGDIDLETEVVRPANIRPPVVRCTTPGCRNIPKNTVDGKCRKCLGEPVPGGSEYQVTSVPRNRVEITHTTPNGKAAPSISWEPADLDAIAEGDTADSVPALLPRSDEVTLLYPGKRHLIAGEPEGGKGWLAMLATAQELQTGNRVLYLDFEDSPKTALDRLLALGLPLRDILEGLTYIPCDDPVQIAALTPALLHYAEDATLVVLDGLTEAMQLLNLDPNSGTDVAKFYAATLKPMADAGACALGLDHVVKDREGRGRWAIGSQHKISGVDTAFSLETRKPFGRGVTGAVSTLRLVKDRGGYLQRHTVGARILSEVRFDSLEDGVRVSLEPPQDTASADFRPTALMERVSRFLTLNGDQTSNAIAEGVPGKRQYVLQALRVLVEEGYVEAKPGPRRSLIHSNLRPFREDEDEDE